MSFPNIEIILNRLSHVQYFINVFNLIIQYFVYLDEMIIYGSRSRLRI